MNVNGRTTAIAATGIAVMVSACSTTAPTTSTPATSDSTPATAAPSASGGGASCEPYDLTFVLGEREGTWADTTVPVTAKK